MLHIAVDIGLSIEREPAHANGNQMRSFVVRAPDLAVGSVLRETDGGRLSSLGSLSPPSKVTLFADAKRNAGVPSHAATFCFMYPMQCFAGKEDRLVSENVVHAQEHMDEAEPAWLDALLYGAFVYCDADDNIIQINALTLRPSQAVKGQLYLDGPHKANPSAYVKLAQSARVQPVTLFHMTKLGFTTFAWVTPGEAPGNTSLSEEQGMEWPHGAFVYTQKAEPPSVAEPGDDGPDRITHVFYRIARTPSLSEPPTSAPDVSGERARVVDGSGVATALAELHSVTESVALRQRQIAAQLTEAHRSPIEVWLRTHSLVVLSYYMVGCAAYSYFENWSLLDSVYFITAMATTVGFGDFAPRTLEARAFTTLYALVGVVVIVGATVELVEPIVHEASTYMSRWTHLAPTKVEDYWRHYLTVLPGPALSLFCLAIVGVILMHEAMLDSVYWAVITMTTVGFGDVVPTSWQSKLALIVLMPLTTASLATSFKDASKIATRAAIRDANFRLNVKSMLLREAGGRPQTQLSKEAFVLAVLKEYDLVDMRTLITIEDEFNSIVSIRDDGADDQASSGEQTQTEPSMMLDCRTVYSHLVRQRRVRHRGEMIGVDSATAVAPTVDMSAPDRGFGEWYEHHWKKDVIEYAELHSTDLPRSARSQITMLNMDVGWPGSSSNRTMPQTRSMEKIMV